MQFCNGSFFLPVFVSLLSVSSLSSGCSTNRRAITFVFHLLRSGCFQFLMFVIGIFIPNDGTCCCFVDSCRKKSEICIEIARCFHTEATNHVFWIWTRWNKSRTAYIIFRNKISTFSLHKTTDHHTPFEYCRPLQVSAKDRYFALLLTNENMIELA